MKEKLTYSEISKIVKEGKAAEVFRLGDCIDVAYKDTDGDRYNMPFVVVKFGSVKLRDGSVVPGMYLQSKYATVENIAFDEAEPENKLSNGEYSEYIGDYGYNRWSESGIRAWLNSDASAGEWFGDTFERNGAVHDRRKEDVEPDECKAYNGFLKGLDPEFIKIVSEVEITTGCNFITDRGVFDITHDRFFLPSLGEYNDEFYKDEKDEGKFYALENHSSTQSVRLRSASRGYSCYTWHVASGGYVGYYDASSALRCTPACVIA